MELLQKRSTYQYALILACLFSTCSLFSKIDVRISLSSEQEKIKKHIHGTPPVTDQLLTQTENQ